MKLLFFNAKMHKFLKLLSYCECFSPNIGLVKLKINIFSMQKIKKNVDNCLLLEKSGCLHYEYFYSWLNSSGAILKYIFIPENASTYTCMYYLDNRFVRPSTENTIQWLISSSIIGFWIFWHIEVFKMTCFNS